MEKSEAHLAIDTEKGTLEEHVTQPKIKVTRNKVIDAIKSAMSAGQLNPMQAAQMLADIKLPQAFYTRKQLTKAQRKAKRKVQRTSRRKNRGLSKGRKCTKGTRFTKPKT